MRISLVISHACGNTGGKLERRCTKVGKGLVRKREIKICRARYTKYKRINLKYKTFSSLKRKDGSITTERHEVAERLMENFVRNSCDQRPTGDFDEARGEFPSPGVDETECTPEEARAILKRLPNDKSPGADLIEVKVLKWAWPVIGREYVRLVNACLKLGVFPRIWKEGSIRVLLKDTNKDPMEVKSYRPVCLLSLLGKLFKRLLLGPMRVDVLKPGYFADWQYGFMQGHSTEDAILRLRKIVDENRESKYILGLLFDITGAFGNVRWPLVHQGLKERSCPANVFEVLKSYFRDRRMAISWDGGNVARWATRGCPQGSVLGPCAWNIIFDKLLTSLFEKLYVVWQCRCQALQLLI